MRTLVNTYFKFIPTAIFLTLCATSLFLISSNPVHAYGKTSNISRVISLNDSAHIIKKGSGVRRPLAVGDFVQKGDVVEVIGRNYVNIAIDRAGKNVIHLEGDAVMGLDNGSIAKVDLVKGKMIALLDDLPNLGGFEVSTPSAVASVRGTYFKVNSQVNFSSMHLYKGSLAVTSIDANGKRGGSAVLVPGYETFIDFGSSAPGEPTLMSRNSFGEINNVISSLPNPPSFLIYGDLVDKVDSDQPLISANDDQQISPALESEFRNRSRLVVSTDKLRQVKADDGDGEPSRLLF
ncbi:MAG: hypothetical protein ACI9CF_000965 [Candidatus Omnitrophota bacterium]|jgi:hypothetical protein